MDERIFWELVESSRAAAKGSFDRHESELASRLSRLSADEIIAFDRILRQLQVRAYSWDLWGAAFVMHGGCGDDSFTDFRSWLISMGREPFERALADADSLADIAPGADGEEDIFFESFAYVATQVYEKKTGKRKPIDVVAQPEEPSGREWEEDRDELAQRFPRLSAKYADQ